MSILKDTLKAMEYWRWKQCFDQRWIRRLDSHCMEERQRGAPVRDLVADAKRRIAAYEKRAPRRVPAFKSLSNKYVPIYKLV